MVKLPDPRDCPSRPLFSISDIAQAIGRSRRWVLDQVKDGKLKASFEDRHIKKTTRLFSVNDVRRYSPSIADALVEEWHTRPHETETV